MNTKTFYIAACAGMESMSKFPTRELAECQASVWNFNWRHDPTIHFVVVAVELPVADVAVNVYDAAGMCGKAQAVTA